MSKPVFPAEAGTKEYAATLDAADQLAGFRDKFIIPSKANIATKKLAKPGEDFLWVYTYLNLILINSRPLTRAVHLLLRQLSGYPTQGHGKVFGGTARYLGFHWSGRSFH